MLCVCTYFVVSIFFFFQKILFPIKFGQKINILEKNVKFTGTFGTPLIYYEVQARAPKGAHLVKCFFKWFFQNNVFSQISPRIQSFLRSIVFHNLKNLTFSVWRIALVQKSNFFFKSEFFFFHFTGSFSFFYQIVYHPFLLSLLTIFFSTLFARTIARISCSLLARVFFKFLQISSNFFKFL